MVGRRKYDSLLSDQRELYYCGAVAKSSRDEAAAAVVDVLVVFSFVADVFSVGAVAAAAVVAVAVAVGVADVTVAVGVADATVAVGVVDVAAAAAAGGAVVAETGG